MNSPRDLHKQAESYEGQALEALDAANLHTDPRKEASAIEHAKVLATIASGLRISAGLTSISLSS